MSVRKGQKIARPKYKMLYEAHKTDAQRYRSDYLAQIEVTEAVRRLEDAAQIEAAYYRQWAVRFSVAALLMLLALIGTCFR
jgi:hypothetical protein